MGDFLETHSLSERRRSPSFFSIRNGTDGSKRLENKCASPKAGMSNGV